MLIFQVTRGRRPQQEVAPQPIAFDVNQVQAARRQVDNVRSVLQETFGGLGRQQTINTDQFAADFARRAQGRVNTAVIAATQIRIRQLANGPTVSVNSLREALDREMITAQIDMARFAGGCDLASTHQHAPFRSIVSEITRAAVMSQLSEISRNQVVARHGIPVIQ